MAMQFVVMTVAVSLGLLGNCDAQTDLLSLSSNSGTAGGSGTLNLSLTSASGSPPAAIELTLNYPSAEITGFSAVAGPAASAAGKSVLCSGQICLLYGTNDQTIQDGVVAVFTLQIASNASGNLAIQLSNVEAATPLGEPTAMSASNGLLSVPASGISVTPVSSSLGANQTQQFSATVTNASNTAVTWSLSPNTGTISGSGLYTAPSTITSAQTVTVTATSVADTNITATASITLSPTPPSAISVAPATGSGQTQTFAASYSDSSGASAITAAYILVGSSTSSAASCWIQFNAASNTYQLANDAGTAWSAPVNIGSGSATNSQCTLSGAGAGATPSGNNLTVNFPITFAAGYAGAKNVYLKVVDGSGLSSGWQQLGSFTATTAGGNVSTGPVPVCNAQGFPCVVSLTPTNGSGSSGTYTGVFTHSGGATQHYLGYILFLPTPNIVWYTATGSCLVEYNRISNAMRLINDAGTNWLPGIIGLPIGRVGSLTNSHCTLNVGESSATINGTTMTVNAAVTFNPSFTGHLATFMQGFDVTGAYTGMTQFGNWEVSAGVQKPGPYVVDVSPTSGAGSSSTFTFTAGHTSGVSSLSFVTMLVSSVIVGAPACQAFYFPASNTLNLVNDSGSAMVSTNGIAPGTAGTLANSRCSIDTGSASASVSGDNVTVTLPMTFDPGTFGGAKNIYLNAFDDFGNLSHWVNSATWTVQ